MVVDIPIRVGVIIITLALQRVYDHDHACHPAALLDVTLVTGAACRVAREEMAADTAHVQRLSRRLVEGVRAQLEHVVFNGDEGNTYAGCVNLSFAYVEVHTVSERWGTYVAWGHRYKKHC